MTDWDELVQPSYVVVKLYVYVAGGNVCVSNTLVVPVPLAGGGLGVLGVRVQSIVAPVTSAVAWTVAVSKLQTMETVGESWRIGMGFTLIYTIALS